MSDLKSNIQTPKTTERLSMSKMRAKTHNPFKQASQDMSFLESSVKNSEKLKIAAMSELDFKELSDENDIK